MEAGDSLVRFSIGTEDERDLPDDLAQPSTPSECKCEPMNELRYVHLDVFAGRPFDGNPLAVFPSAGNLDERLMQSIAQELNLSETTFVTNGGEEDPRVRIFTPRRELPMAGHPTIGTAFALAGERRLQPGRRAVTFHLGIGPVPVHLDWSGETLAFAWMTQSLPVFEAAPLAVERLAEAIGVTERDIRDSALPIEVASSGVAFLLVPLATREAVDRVVLERAAFRRLCESAGLPELPLLVFSLAPGGDDATTYSRMLAPLFGIAEDPATGGAAGPLGGYLVRHGSIPARTATVVNLQGKSMGRASRIHIAITVQRSRVRELRVGGTAVVVGRGALSIMNEEDYR